MIYPNQGGPENLLNALQLLSDQKRIRKGDLVFRFFGPNVDVVKTLYPSKKMEDYVVAGENLPRNQALTYQMNADLLVVFDWAEGVYSSKFFEYIGTGKPILSVGPKGSVIDHTLTSMGLGLTENDPAALANILEKFIQTGTLVEGHTPKTDDAELLKPFTREYQAEKLAGILDRIIVDNH